jgi:hypothetical protein
VKGDLVGNKGKKSNKPALYWKERAKDGGAIKPLGCCVANCQAVSQVAGSTDMDRWVGARITIYVEDVEIRGEGRRPALRIRPFTADRQRAARGNQSQPGPPKPGPGPDVTPGLAPEADEAVMIAELERMGVDRG